jgi:steroid delta-isomerase-like uncharacterized protein
MDPITVAYGYFGAWNRHDPEAIAAAFTEGGTYSDPTTGRPLTGSEIAQYAARLFRAFPDLAFAPVGEILAGPGRIAAEWTMRGTNTGPFGDMPPTGRAVTLPGADFITIQGDRVRSVQGYFDQRTFSEQLGFQVIVQPSQAGPFEFGTILRVGSDKTAKPGAFSLTWIEVETASEAEEVRNLTRRIVGDLQHAPGFLGWTGGTVGQRLFTVTAWEDPDHARYLMDEGPHREAVHRFFDPAFGGSAWTSVWVPHRLNAVWVRCSSCGTLQNREAQGEACDCGTLLPAPHYW